MNHLDGQLLFEQHAFTNALPIPTVIDTSQRKTVVMQAQQTTQFLGLYSPDGTALSTTVWGYGTGGGKVSYPGPTLLAYTNQAVTVNWQNKLPIQGHLLPVDTTIHLAEPMARPLSKGYVPIVSHLHGGHSKSIYDGLPNQWFTQTPAVPGATGPREVGPDFKTSTYVYENDQQAATIWYHDHALGITRLNVYAGLAGFYIIKDEQRLALEKKGVLPSGMYDLGAAIQDRAFKPDGQLYYPAYKTDELPGQSMTVGDMVDGAFYKKFGDNAPSIVPEFFGDTILVNGMAWPKLNVAAGDYTFRLLNGSDSRFYVLKLDNPNVAVTLVGSDGGLLPKAVTVIDGDGSAETNEFIVLAPGDRLEVVMDFSKLTAGESVRLLNVGPAYEPFKGVDSAGQLLGEAEAATSADGVGNIMQFTVDTKIKAFNATVGQDTVLNQTYERLPTEGAEIAQVRKLGLFEGMDEYGRVMPMLGTAEVGAVHSSMDDVDGTFGPLAFDAEVTETPTLGTVENWQIFNFTADSHPIHLHLVQFQAVEKRLIDFQDVDENGIPDDTNNDGMISYGDGPVVDYTKHDIWIGDTITLRPEDMGWQDTLYVNPGEMLSIVAEFDKPGNYVWHCHILSHEDNEMMRPFTVVEEPLVV